MTRYYPDLSSAFDWSCRVRNLLPSIRSTTQIWVVTRHQYGISPLFSLSDVISRGNQWRRLEMSAVFSGYRNFMLFLEKWKTHCYQLFCGDSNGSFLFCFVFFFAHRRNLSMLAFLQQLNINGLGEHAFDSSCPRT